MSMPKFCTLSRDVDDSIKNRSDVVNHGLKLISRLICTTRTGKINYNHSDNPSGGAITSDRSRGRRVSTYSKFRFTFLAHGRQTA